jgi:hypothetical protein
MTDRFLRLMCFLWPKLDYSDVSREDPDAYLSIR